MRKVYVLNGGCIGDRYVVAVFSSMKKALKERERIIKNDTYYMKSPEDLDIDTFVLNAGKDGRIEND